MPDRSRFGELIEERCAALGITSQVELGRLLARRGVTVSANTLSAWHIRSRPRAGRLAALLDVLELHGPDRDRAYRLANEVEVGDDAPGPVAGSNADDAQRAAALVANATASRGLDDALTEEPFTLPDVDSSAA